MLQVNELVGSSATAKAVFDSLAKRERFRRETNIVKFERQLIHEGNKIVEDEFYGVWKALEDLGYGTLIHGRGGKSTRFKWHVNLKDVAKLANEPNASVEVEPLPATFPKKTRRNKKRTTRRKARIGRPKGSKNLPKVANKPIMPVSETDQSSIIIHLRKGVSEDILVDLMALMAKINK